MLELPVTLEAVLVRLAQSRTDEDAWRVLYRQTWPFVYAAVYRRLRGSRALAEDASQEVFIRLVRACPFERLLDPDAFRRYVWRVADNVARDQARHAAHRYAIEVSLPEVETSGMGIQNSARIDENLDARDLLRHIVNKVVPADRQMLRLTLQGKTLSEIAKSEGLTYRNAAVRLHRLRQRLRNFLFLKESGLSK